MLGTMVALQGLDCKGEQDCCFTFQDFDISDVIGKEVKEVEELVTNQGECHGGTQRGLESLLTVAIWGELKNKGVIT